jgi:hypothetical protein
VLEWPNAVKPTAKYWEIYRTYDHKNDGIHFVMKFYFVQYFNLLVFLPIKFIYIGIDFYSGRCNVGDSASLEQLSMLI